MNKSSFLIFKNFYGPIKDLSNEDLGSLFRIIFEYQILLENPKNPVGLDKTQDEFFENLEKVNVSVKMAFCFFKNQFDLDHQKYLQVVERNKSNGIKGGRPKKENNPPPLKKTQKTQWVIQEPKKADNDKDKDKEKEKKIIKKENGEVSVIPKIPDFINSDLWNSFVEMRKKSKKPLTEKAVELIIKSLSEFEEKQSGSANLSLENSIKSGWQGVFEPKGGYQKFEKNGDLELKHFDYKAYFASSPLTSDYLK